MDNTEKFLLNAKGVIERGSADYCHLDKKNKDISDNQKGFQWGTWVAQLVKHPTSAQVRISRFVSSSSMLGSVLNTCLERERETEHERGRGRERERGRHRI